MCHHTAPARLYWTRLVDSVRECLHYGWAREWLGAGYVLATMPEGRNKAERKVLQEAVRTGHLIARDQRDRAAAPRG